MLYGVTYKPSASFGSTVYNNLPELSSMSYSFTPNKGGVKYKLVNLASDQMYVMGLTASGSKKTAINIPSKVKIGGSSYKVVKINSKAFSKSKAKKVTIGANVTSIGNKAFYKCTQLSKITIKSKSLKSVGKSSIKGTSKKLKIKVPASKKSSYKKKFKKAGNSRATIM